MIHFQLFHSISHPLCHHRFILWFTTHSILETRLITNPPQFGADGEDLHSLKIISRCLLHNNQHLTCCLE